MGDNWEMVEAAFNVFKHEITLYRKEAGFDKSDAWLVGWCLGNLEWTDAAPPNGLKEELCDGIDEAVYFGSGRDLAPMERSAYGLMKKRRAKKGGE